MTTTRTFADYLRMALDVRAFAAACGYPELDDWQAELLEDEGDTILLCGRQVGKSFTLGLKCLRHAMFRPNSEALIVSAGMRQAGEVLAHVTEMYRCIGRPICTSSENVSQIVLETGSRVLSLPSMPPTVRGYSPSLICVDEASQVPDEMFSVLRPMQAVTRAQMIMASTPYGKRGFFHREWIEGGPKRWRRVKVRTAECPRVDKAWLEAEMQSGAAWYTRQEFDCEFSDYTEQIFSEETINRIFDNRIGVLPIVLKRSVA